LNKFVRLLVISIFISNIIILPSINHVSPSFVSNYNLQNLSFVNVYDVIKKGKVIQSLGYAIAPIKYYDKALAIQPDNTAALINKGVVLYNLGNYTEAIKYYDKALAIQPNYVNALNNKGNAIAKTIEMDNTNPVVYGHSAKLMTYPIEFTFYNNDKYYFPTTIFSKIALTLTDIAKYNQCIKYYDKALTTNPNATDILNNKGLALLHLEKYDEALKVFDKSISINSKFAPSLYNKGVYLDKLGNHTRAQYYQQKA